MEREKKKFGVSFNEMQGELQKSTPAFIAYTIAAFLLMFITALAVFFFANKGYEQVLVPDVTGKSLTRVWKCRKGNCILNFNCVTAICLARRDKCFRSRQAREASSKLVAELRLSSAGVS